MKTSRPLWFSQRFCNTIEKAIQTEKSASILLPDVQIEISQFTPTAKLTSALKESVSNERLQILLYSFQGDDLHGKVDRIILDHRVVELIGGLTDSEQAAVIRFSNGNKVIDSTKKTRAEKINEILTGLGIYKGRVIYPKSIQGDSYIDGVLKEK